MEEKELDFDFGMPLGLKEAMNSMPDLSSIRNHMIMLPNSLRSQRMSVDSPSSMVLSSLAPEVISKRYNKMGAAISFTTQ